ncbi:MAG: glycosyltransferase family 39 protein [Candidatus Pacearchaeota archaeon]|jgi:hypothetical protein
MFNKEKLKEWLKKKENLILLAVVIIAFLIRIYYFTITSSQPLWWDEAEYMSAAKGFAGIVHYHLDAIRSPGFPLFASIFFIIGISNEVALRFLILLIPSLILIVLTYFTIKEMYPDKRIAIISTLIIAVLWENLFYSNRFHTENLALIFELLAIFILVKVYLKKKDLWVIKPKYSIIWIALFSLISILFRPGNVIFIPAIVVFLLIVNKSKILTKKGLPITIGIIALGIIAFFVLGLQNNAFFATYLKSFQTHAPFTWSNLSFFYGIYQSPVQYLPSILFYAFLLGVIFFVVDMFLFSKKIKSINNTSEDLEIKSDILNMLIILSIMSFFIFFMRPPTYEFRWFFPLMTGLLVFTAKGIVTFSEYIGDFLKSKKLVIILIIILTLLGVYAQFVHADAIIKIKIPTYQQVKDAGLWIKQNSNKNDVVVAASITQLTYYGERKIEDFYVNNSNENESAFDIKVKNVNPKYMVISVFEPGFTPQWAYDWPQRHNQTLTPIKMYLLDDQDSPALVIYEFKNYSKTA